MNKQQLNITCGTDVVLHDRLEFDGEVFDPSLSTDIVANLVNSLGKRTALDVEVVDDYLVIDVPWVEGRNAGCYGLEVKGVCNERKWSTYADALIRYTRATVEGAAEVEVESDYYDITQVVGYRYTDSPIRNVTVEVDDNYGEPEAVTTYDGRDLDIELKNIRGNGIVSVEQTVTSTEDEGVNEATITQDNGNTTVIQVRNGSKGDKGDKGDTGDSAIFNPETGNISEMKQATGDSIVSPMSQKAVTDELFKCQFVKEGEISDDDFGAATLYINSSDVYKSATSSTAALYIKGSVTESLLGKTLIFHPQSDRQVIFAFVKNAPVNNAAVVYSDVVNMKVYGGENNVVKIAVPADAVYIYIQTLSNGNNVKPSQIEFGSIKTITEVNDGLKEEIGMIDESVEHIQDFAADVIPGDVTYDLALSDEIGNDIALFSGGHVKTKNFDSSNVVEQGDGDDIDDFSVSDASGHEIVRFSGGHVKTKNFDSSGVAKRPYQRRTFYTYPVECSNPINTTFQSVDLDSPALNSVKYYDNAVLYLPETYHVGGTPTKLVIWCKGGTWQIEPSSDNVMNTPVSHYLLSLGYAILAADGLPNAWASALGICERVVGNYVAVQSVKKAYDLVMRDYNLDHNGCYVYGISQGGHYAQNVADLCGIKVLAVAETSPVCSYKFHQWDLNANYTVGGVKYTKAARLNIARIFGYPSVSTNAALLALAYDETKQQGYDPWLRNVEDPYIGFVQSGNLWHLPMGTSIADITMKKRLSCPLKVWCCDDDNILGTDVMKVFIKAARNAGCVAEIQAYTTGGHEITGQAAIGTYIDNGETYDLTPLQKEIGLWYSQFGGYNIL